MRPTPPSGVSTSRRPTSTWPLTLAPAVCDVFQAVSYDALARALEPDSRWELAGVTTRRLRRLLAARAEAIRPAG